MKKGSKMLLGAIAGDVIGSVYEWENCRSMDVDLFPKKAFFTDDTVMTIAVADAILNGGDFSETLWRYGNRYPGRGYGGRFKKWLESPEPEPPYGSFGNGSAMRGGAAGFACGSLEATLELAAKTAACTHDHPEGIKGAEATAAVMFWARQGAEMAEIRQRVEARFGYDLGFTIDQIRPTYRFNETCQGTVPQAIVAFLESENYEHALRKALSVGGDSDTMACIVGGMAMARFGEMPSAIVDFVEARLPVEFLETVEAFDERFGA